MSQRGADRRWRTSTGSLILAAVVALVAAGAVHVDSKEGTAGAAPPAAERRAAPALPDAGPPDLRRRVRDRGRDRFRFQADRGHRRPVPLSRRSQALFHPDERDTGTQK